MSLVLLGVILGMFLNKLTCKGNYPIDHLENLRVPKQMQLSEKRKTFSLVPFIESSSNFEHFEHKRRS